MFIFRAAATAAGSWLIRQPSTWLVPSSERFHGDGHKTVRPQVQGFFLFRRELKIADMVRAEADDHGLVRVRMIMIGMVERPFDDADDVIGREAGRSASPKTSATMLLMSTQRKSSRCSRKVLTGPPSASSGRSGSLSPAMPKNRRRQTFGGLVDCETVWPDCDWPSVTDLLGAAGFSSAAL